MLIEFRVKNFLSFRDDQTLSMVAANDKSLPANRFTEGKFDLLRAAVVYGANASGKSNLIKAVRFMGQFVKLSARINPGDKIPVTPFRLDAQRRKEPSEFETTFVLDGVRYQYGFAVSAERVHDEWLLAYPFGRPQRWFERTWQPEQQGHKWAFSSRLTGRKNALAQETGDNKLFLSHAADRNHAQLTPIYRWFRACVRTLDPGSGQKGVTERYLAENDEFRSTILDILRDADFGISDIALGEEKVDVERVERFFKTTPDNKNKELAPGALISFGYEVRAKHRNPKTQEEVLFDLKDESDGTRRFFALVGPWIEALALGYTVFVDELHYSLHPLLARKLVDLFQNDETNPHGAQLVCTTHDVTLLDDELFRRDQIWFTEKDPAGASHLYSLQSYKDKPRKTGAWQKGYLAGRYGALPFLGAFALGPEK